MTKHHKKRNKSYQGPDAKSIAHADPIIHRYEAIDRGSVGQWWHDRRNLLRRVTVVVAGAGLVVWMMVELLRIAAS